MKIESRNSRDYVYLVLRELDNEQFDNRAIMGLNEDAMNQLCEAIDGKHEDFDLPCIPIVLYASYDDWDGMVEFRLESVETKTEGYIVTYKYGTVIK